VTASATQRQAFETNNLVIHSWLVTLSTWKDGQAELTCVINKLYLNNAQAQDRQK